MKIKMRSKDIGKFINSLRDVSKRQIPYATSRALNDTAFDVLGAEVRALNKHLDRPTPFTGRAYMVIKANKQRLVAYIKARPIQGEYLQWAVFGGVRKPKKRSIVVPVDRLKNQYGNMPKNTVKTLLRANTTFSTKPGFRTSHIAPGIYERYKQGNRNRLRFLVAYEPAVDYSKRLPFFEVANATAKRVLRRRIMLANARAMRTSR